MNPKLETQGGKNHTFCSEIGAGWLVAQVSNLLYRRLLVGRLLESARACGLEIRDTAGWKPALRLRHAKTRELSGLARKAEVRNGSACTGCLARLGMTFVLGLLGLLASPLAAQPTNQTTVLLDHIAQNLGRMESVFARFAQERHLSLFEEPLRSQGYLCFQKPGRLRWEITQPYQSILVSDGKGVAQYERIGDQWKKLELGLADAVQTVVAQIGAVMEGRYTGKQRDYTVTATNTADGPVITLTPQHPAMRKMMQAIEIHLAPDCRGTRQVVLREVGGDFTDIRFSEQVAEPPLPAGTFDRNKPADLEKIRQAVQSRKGAPAEEPSSK